MSERTVPDVEQRLTKNLIIILRLAPFEGSLGFLKLSSEGSDICVGILGASLFDGRLEVRYSGIEFLEMEIDPGTSA